MPGGFADENKSKQHNWCGGFIDGQLEEPKHKVGSSSITTAEGQKEHTAGDLVVQ